MSIILGVIYRATSPSGRCYIGQTIKQLKERMRVHFYHASHPNSRYYNTKFSKAIRKYSDLIKWEILHYNVPKDLLNLLEKQEIENHNSFTNGYNGTIGGDGGGFIGKKHTDESKMKISLKGKGKNSGSKNGMYGKSGDENPFFGKKHTEQTKKKMSQNRPDMSGKNNPRYGVKLSQETLFKIKNTKSRNKAIKLGLLNQSFFVKKSWGQEEILVNNEKYCGKILTINKNKYNSYHYHIDKTETFYILDGLVLLFYGADDCLSLSNTKILKSGDTFHIEKGVRHRFLGLEDSQIIEISTHHEDSDSIRLLPSSPFE